MAVCVLLAYVLPALDTIRREFTSLAPGVTQSAASGPYLQLLQFFCEFPSIEGRGGGGGVCGFCPRLGARVRLVVVGQAGFERRVEQHLVVAAEATVVGFRC